MKRLKQIAILFFVTVGLATSPQALAQEMILQSNGNTPVDRLQANCDNIRSTLRRLHTSDALLRVNVGQEYNTVSAQLMAKLNSRLAINRIDSAKLVAISAQFDNQRTAFSSNYSEYETLLAALIKIDCKNSPTEFYAALLSARDARHKLTTAVQSMNDSLVEYRLAVEQLRHQLFGNNGAADAN